MDDEGVTNVFHGPVDARHATFGYRHESAPGASSRSTEPAGRRFPGSTKVAVCARLTGDWADLADRLDVPIADRARFDRGREPHGVWEWLETRDRLGELRPALLDMDRPDLAALLDDDRSG